MAGHTHKHTIEIDTKTNAKDVDSLASALQKIEKYKKNASKSGLKDLDIKVKVDSDKSAKELDGLASQISKVAKDVKSIKSPKLKLIDPGSAKAINNINSLGSSVSKLEKNLKGINAKSITGITSAVNTLTDSFMSAASAAGNLADATKSIGGNLNGAISQANQLSKAYKDAANNAGDVARNSKSIGGDTSTSGSSGGSNRGIGTGGGFGAIAESALISATGKGAHELSFSNAATKQTHKRTVDIWAREDGGDATATWKAINKEVNASTATMNATIPSMNAFKASTGASTDFLKDNADVFASLATKVQALGYTEQDAQNAMMDLSKGVHGAFASLDQYGISEESLKAKGWSGDEKDLQGYMDAVKAVMGDATDYENTWNYQKAMLNKDMMRGGEKLFSDVMKPAAGALKAFNDFDKGLFDKFGVNIGTAITGLSMLDQGLQTVRGTIDAVKTGAANIKQTWQDMKSFGSAVKNLPKTIKDKWQSAKDTLGGIKDKIFGKKKKDEDKPEFELPKKKPQLEPPSKEDCENSCGLDDAIEKQQKTGFGCDDGCGEDCLDTAEKVGKQKEKNHDQTKKNQKDHEDGSGDSGIDVFDGDSDSGSGKSKKDKKGKSKKGKGKNGKKGKKGKGRFGKLKGKLGGLKGKLGGKLGRLGGLAAGTAGAGLLGGLFGGDDEEDSQYMQNYGRNGGLNKGKGASKGGKLGKLGGKAKGLMSKIGGGAKGLVKSGVSAGKGLLSGIGSVFKGGAGKGVFKGLTKTLGSGLGKAAAKIGGKAIFGTLGKAAFSCVPVIGQVAAAAWMVTDVLDMLGIDWFTPLSQGVGAVLDQMGPLGQTIKQVGGQAMECLGGAGDWIMGGFEKLMNGESLGSVLMGGLGDIRGNISNILRGVSPEFADFFDGISSKGMEILGGAGDWIMGGLSKLMSGAGIGEVIWGGLKDIGGNLTNIFSGISETIGPVFQGISDFVGGLFGGEGGIDLGGLVSSLSPLTSIIGMLGNLDIGGALKGAFDWISSLDIGGIFGQIASAASPLLDVLGQVGSLAESAFGWLKDNGPGIWDGICSGAQQLWDILCDIGGKITEILGPLQGAGQWVMDTLGLGGNKQQDNATPDNEGGVDVGTQMAQVDGLMSKLQTVRSTIQSAITDTANFIATTIGNMITTIGTSINTVFQQIGTTISTTFQSVATSINSVINTLVSGFTTVAGLLPGMVSGVFQLSAGFIALTAGVVGFGIAGTMALTGVSMMALMAMSSLLAMSGSLMVATGMMTALMAMSAVASGFLTSMALSSQLLSTNLTMASMAMMNMQSSILGATAAFTGFGALVAGELAIAGAAILTFTSTMPGHMTTCANNMKTNFENGLNGLSAKVNSEFSAAYSAMCAWGDRMIAKAAEIGAAIAAAFANIGMGMGSPGKIHDAVVDEFKFAQGAMVSAQTPLSSTASDVGRSMVEGYMRNNLPLLETGNITTPQVKIPDIVKKMTPPQQQPTINVTINGDVDSQDRLNTFVREMKRAFFEGKRAGRTV